MCGRYVHPDQAAMERGWQIGRTQGNPFDRRFNVAPTMGVPMLRWEPDRRAFELAPAYWGFIPTWWKDDKPPRNTINARTEEIHSKPMWRAAFRHARCLLPAVGWYEWQPRSRTDPSTGEITTFKQPYFIRPLDGRLIAFAGIWSARVPDPRAGAASCAILTRASAGDLTAVHDRMPVVLGEAGIAAWIDPGVTDPAEVIARHALEDFVFAPVSTRVNQRGAEGPQLIEPVSEPSI